MKKIAALLYIFILIFTSCEEEVDYYDLGVKNFIVVNGKFVDGETPWCQVSRSDIIFEQIKNKITPTVFLPNANVTVTEGNSDYKYVVIGDSAVMEAEGVKVKAGETYTLRAKSDGLDDVYTTVSVPSKPKAELRFISVEKEKVNEMFYFDVFENQERVKITYELNLEDDPNTEDYYQILFHANTKEYDIIYEIDTIRGYWNGDDWVDAENGPDKIYRSHPTHADSTIAYKIHYELLTSNDPIMNWNQNQSDNNLFESFEYNDRSLFNDQLFNGQTTKIRFNLYIYEDEDQYYSVINYNDPIYYELRHINKEMYLYNRTYQKVVNNDMAVSLSPYMLYCNVQNGAGLVAAWSSVKKQLEIPDFQK